VECQISWIDNQSRLRATMAALRATCFSSQMAGVDAGDEQFHVVVQNTFVSVVDASTSAASRQSLLRAVRSESYLCDLGNKRSSWLDIEEEDEADAEADCPEVDDSQAISGSGKAVFQHQRSCSEASSTTVNSVGVEEDDASSEDLRDTSSQISSSAQEPSAAADVDHMAMESERLAHENAALLEEVRRLRSSQEHAAQDAPLMPAVAATQGVFTHADGPAPGFSSYGIVWMPVELACVSQTWMPSREYAEVHSEVSGSQASGVVGASRNSESSRTTVMLRNLPNNYTRATLMELMEKEGFGSAYNFLYLPIDFKTQAALGYAFVNLVHPCVAEQFWRVFDGFSRWSVPSRKLCLVSWCEPHQGLETQIERYRNSPVMHDSVPDVYKPVLLQGGVRVCFPPPTKAMRAPRGRDCRRDHR